MEFVGRPEQPRGVRRLLFRLPIRLYRARLGFLLGKRFLLIEHRGRKSGKCRQVVVEVVVHDPLHDEVVVASGFGPKADWYLNVLAHPEVTIQLGSRSWRARAVKLEAEEAAEAMVHYARRHPRAARGLSRFMGFRVDGSERDYRAVGERVPMIRFSPV